MPGGAPTGNQNAANAKLWRAAINRALDKRTKKEGKEAMDELAEKLLELCDEGNLGALQELGSRIEGKPAQAIIGGDEDDPAIKVTGKITLVRPTD